MRRMKLGMHGQVCLQYLEILPKLQYFFDLFISYTIILSS